jgi:hypothetical protein
MSLSIINEITHHLEKYFYGDIQKIHHWLTTENSLLQNEKPIEYMMFAGAHKLLNFIEQKIINKNEH